MSVNALDTTAANVDFTIYDNVTWQDAFQFGDSTDTTWDFLSKTFTLSIKRFKDDAVPLLTITSTGGNIVVSDAALRILYMDVPDTTIQDNLPEGDYVYDMIMTDADSIRTRLLYGNLTVEHGITS